MSADTATLVVMRPPKRIQWVKSIPFLAMQFAWIGAFWTGVRSSDWWWCLWFYLIRMFFVSGFAHRYFSHRTFKTTRVFQFIMALLFGTTAQKGILWWAGHHRDHHKNADTPQDVHSPSLEGFWWSHMGWIMSNQYNHTRSDLLHDLEKFPELVWLNKYWWISTVCMAVGIFAWSGWSGLYIRFFLSTAILYQCTFLINSLVHVKLPWWLGPMASWRSHATPDTSENNFVLALITLGEGWHNPHHYRQYITKQGTKWWQIDISFYVLWLMSLPRIISGVTTHPKQTPQPA